MSEEEKKEDDTLDRVVTQRRKLFDYAIGAAVPVVLSLSIGLINRIDNLEHYRDLDDYRMGEFQKWRDHGEFRRLYTDTLVLAQELDHLSRKFGLCQQRVDTLEKGWLATQKFPFTDKGSE